MVKGDGNNQNIETQRGKKNGVMVNLDDESSYSDRECGSDSGIESVFTFGDWNKTDGEIINRNDTITIGFEDDDEISVEDD